IAAFSLTEKLLCRQCGHEITSSDHIHNIGSNLALRQRNDTIVGDKRCLVQLFKNPIGHHFELITAKSASLLLHGKAHLEHSWFPEYAWKIATCPQCGVHLGWSFENPNPPPTKPTAEENTTKKKKQPYAFVGLIFPHLIQENYADSLIVTPKAYRG
ncbi:protein cereblon, partial [Exaiptasia diaphana]|uniref:CULT domain-containing protein n=1 Tax=Exaiptasia diaphana TaxID=2652724 RepID=A0A913WXX0_EXADI